MNAPWTGGFAPRERLFAVDGDFTRCDPCSPPRISYPMRGDSVYSNADIVVMLGDVKAGTQDYYLVQLGTFPNLQPWSSNQKTIVIEQEFVVAMNYYKPMTLNTPYNLNWSIGWEGLLTNNQPTQLLQNCFLVEEGDLEDYGIGLVKVRRRWASLPPTRNELEQFTYLFPALTITGGTGQRDAFNRTVQSRIQYDYFIFDDFQILQGLLGVFPNGPTLDATTGLNPPYLILEPYQSYANLPDAIKNGNFLPDGSPLTNPTPGNTNQPGSKLTVLEWQNLSKGIGTSNGQPAEIIAEASCMRRWYGNIWERRTRFIQII